MVRDPAVLECNQRPKLFLGLVATQKSVKLIAIKSALDAGLQQGRPVYTALSHHNSLVLVAGKDLATPKDR